MTHERNDHPHFSEHERSEVEILANTVLSAFELADAVEVHEIQPSSHEIERTVPPELFTEDLMAQLLPAEVMNQIDTSGASLDITYQFPSQEVRPSLELRLHKDTNDTTENFATIYRPSGDLNQFQDFKGNAIVGQDAREYEFSLAADAVASVIQSLLKSEDGHVVTDEGVLTIKLIQELVLDPQLPPVARYIYDVLAMRNMSVKDETNYPIEIDDTNFLVRTSIEDGKTTVVTIIEVLHDEIEVLNDDISHTYNAIGARISRTQLSQAIEFFKVSKAGDELPYDGDSNDLQRLRERMNLLQEHVTAG